MRAAEKSGGSGITLADNGGGLNSENEEDDGSFLRPNNDPMLNEARDPSWWDGRKGVLLAVTPWPTDTHRRNLASCS